MRVEHTATPSGDWDDFVSSHPQASLAHAAAWPEVLRRAYGVKSHCLIARDEDGSAAGVLAVSEVRTVRGARELVSLPYLDGAGVLARDAEAERSLLDALWRLARERAVRFVELRQLGPLEAQALEESATRVSMLLALEETEELQWKTLRAKVRNQTRKAEKSGLLLAPGSDLGGFYEPFCGNMRDLGTPVHARAFFEAAADAFGERLRFVATHRTDRPVGGLVAIDFAGRVTVPWASTLRSERASCPNNQIYWEALRWAIGRGVRCFDFGRSPRDGGTHRFKRGWGAEERPMFWSRFDAGGHPIPSRDERDGAWLRRASWLWARLPRSVVDRLGPRLRPYLTS